ncbi:hypothetical protein WG922_17115 [Ramlibacter sp. AN1015]
MKALLASHSGACPAARRLGRARAVARGSSRSAGGCGVSAASRG